MRSSLLVAFAAIALAGCGQSEPTPTPTATATPPAAAPAFTATPSPAAGAVPQPGATVVPISNQADAPATAAPTVSGLLPEPTATPVPTSVPTSAPSPEGRMATGKLLHRYGDYENARAVFNEVQNDTTVPPELRREATYDLARAYLADGLYGEAVTTLDSLDQALSADGADPNQFGLKEQFLRGEAHMGQGQYDAAIAAYGKFLEAYPWMNEGVQPRIAGAYLALNDPANAAAALRVAADAANDNTSKAGLLEQLAQARVDAGDYAGAVAAYDEILSFAQNTTYRALQQYQAGQALAAAGDEQGAIARWQAATQEEPSASSAYLSLVELVNRNVDFDLYQRGLIDYYAEAYEPAANAFTAYISAVDSTDSRFGNALHGLGLAYLGSGAYVDAIAAFARVITEQPQCDCYGQAWLDKAQALLESGDGADARRTYRTFAREHADNPLASEALWQSGVAALGDGNQVEAAVDFLALADAFPQSERTPPALYALGIGAFSKNLFSQSVQVLTRLQSGYPDYRPEAVNYWLGRALAADNNLEGARTQWQALVDRAPDVYYGILAAYALADIPMTSAAMLDRIDAVAGAAGRLAGDDGSQAFAEQWLSTWITDTQGNIAELPPTLAEDPDLIQGRLLLDLDRRGDALGPLERFYDRNSDNPAALYPMSLEFARLGAYRLSLLSAARLLVLSQVPLVEDGPIFIQRLAYPRPFNDLIVREAQAADLNPSLYFSLIRQESLFEEGAQSSAAAQGLAQIIPDTGHWVAEQVGHPEYTNDIIYRPVINVRFGAYYLDWVRDLLDGNLISALAGYNAGPGNADNWREDAGADDTLFVEQLTYSEPRIYIQQVLGNLYHYTRLYR